MSVLTKITILRVKTVRRFCEGYVFTGVCLSTGGVLPPGGVLPRGRGGASSGGGAWWRHPPRRLLLRAVRIPLECILVYQWFH